MKVLRYLLLVIPVLLMASNCPNKKNKEPNVIKGRLMYGCETPAPNVPLMLKAGSKFVETVDGLKEIYTDENGYFEFKFQPVMSWYTLMSSSEKIMSQIPNQDFVDLGEVNIAGRVNYYVKIEVTNPYTENDTLVYTDLINYTEVRVPGPFESGIIDTFMSVPFNNYPVTYEQTPRMYLTYFVKPYVSGSGKHCNLYIPFCNDNIFEAKLIID